MGRHGSQGASRETGAGVRPMPPVVVLLLLSIIAALGAAVRAQGEAGVGPNGASIDARRSLYVMVRDEKKQFVKGLGADNFALYEGGERRPLELREAEPARIALLVEYTRATQSYREELFSAMRGFEKAAPPGHWYALASYGTQLTIANDFTKRRGEVVQAFLSLQFPERHEIGTYDAIYTMIDNLSWMSGRRALIVIGSGFDSLSRMNQGDILRRLDSSGVVVFALGTLSEARRSPDLDMFFELELGRNQGFLKRLAERSGGFARFPLVEDGFAGAMAEILAGIDAQYELQYTPTVSGPHVEDVEVKAFMTSDNGARKDFQVTMARPNHRR
jgi:VWFA-related protein